MIRYAPLLALLLCSAAPQTFSVRLIVPAGFQGQVVVVSGETCGQEPEEVNGVEQIRVPTNGIVILRDGLGYRSGELHVLSQGDEIPPPPPMEMGMENKSTEEGYAMVNDMEIDRMKNAEYVFVNSKGQETAIPSVRLSPAGKPQTDGNTPIDPQTIYGANTGFWIEGKCDGTIVYTTYTIAKADDIRAIVTPERKAEIIAAVKACRGH